MVRKVSDFPPGGLLIVENASTTMVRVVVSELGSILSVVLEPQIYGASWVIIFRTQGFYFRGFCPLSDPI